MLHKNKWRQRASSYCQPEQYTIRTTRSRTSGAYFVDACFVMMTPSSQEVGPPVNPARFRYRTVLAESQAALSGQQDLHRQREPDDDS
jgi:hypothetical protein